MKQLYVALVLLVLSCNHCDGQSLKRDDSAMNYVNFVENQFQKLTSFILNSFDASEPSECFFKCLVNQDCFSLNFGGTGADKRHSCELLSGDMFRELDKLVAHGNFHHYNIETPCMEQPCKNGATCLPIYDQDNYTCACITGYTGRHCERAQTQTIIICENEQKEIHCEYGRKIKVKRANFGRLDNYTCPHDLYDYQSQTNCRAQTSLDRVMAECQKKTSCSLKPTNAFFSEDPCPGIFKYLFVKYKCKKYWFGQ